MFKRYTLTDVTSNQFYQMPKFLFEGELKISLSNDAKVLYSLLRDRHDLSIVNRWVDKNNDVYIIYTRAEMCGLLGCGKQKVTKLCDELKATNLFEEVRQGLSKPNIIYLNYISCSQRPLQAVENELQIQSNSEVRKSNFKEYENQTLRNTEIELQEVRKSNTINTNNINTDSSHTDYQSIYPQEQENVDVIDTIDSREEVIEIVKENIEYDLCKQAQGEKEYVDNIVAVMVDVLCSTSPTARIGKEDKPLSVIKSVFNKLTYEHIQYVCLCLAQTTTQIKSIRSYLITALYNAPQTMDTYYSQRVKHDFA